MIVCVQIAKATTVDEVLDAVDSAGDVLSVLGVTAVIRNLEDRDALLERAVWSYVVGRSLPALQQ